MLILLSFETKLEIKFKGVKIILNEIFLLSTFLYSSFFIKIVIQAHFVANPYSTPLHIYMYIETRYRKTFRLQSPRNSHRRMYIGICLCNKTLFFAKKREQNDGIWNTSTYMDFLNLWRN